MASEKPPLHGHDHLPGHIDPIPGLTDIITTVVGGTLSPAHCLYNSESGVPVTATAGSGGYVDWFPDVGDTTLLDVSGGTTAVVTIRGVYAAHATFSSTSSGWTIGSTYFAVLSGNGDVGQLQSNYQSVTVGEHDLPAGGDLFTGFGHVSLTMDMPVGGQFQLQLANYDNSTHDLSAYIWVQRIYAY